MPSSSRISNLRFTRAHTGGGLLGWVSFQLEPGLLVDGVGLRRSLRGELVFSWPARKDNAGRVHHLVRPLDSAAREAVEGQLLDELRPLVSGRGS
jgi:DNA-binding cell septation regulator SpoVG